jgi:hypothetical protein
MADNGESGTTNTEPTSRTFSSTAAGSPDTGASAASSQGDPETIGTGNETVAPSNESPLPDQRTQPRSGDRPSPCHRVSNQCG